MLTLVFGTLAILTCWVPPRGRVYLVWARAWARCVLFCCGLSPRVTVDPAVRGVPAAIYMPNHESTLDILVMLVAVPHEVRFLAKRSLFHVPILGWSMKLGGFIPVDRKRTEHAKEVFDLLERRLAEGISVLIFPEGTRSRDRRLQPFKKAGFLLALRTGLPIVPVGITGSGGVLPAGSLGLTRKALAVRIGAPVPTAGLAVSRRAELMATVREAVVGLAGSTGEAPASR